MNTYTKISLVLLALEFPNLKAGIVRSANPKPYVTQKSSVKQTVNYKQSWASEKFKDNSFLITIGASALTAATYVGAQQGYLNTNLPLKSVGLTVFPLISSLALMKTTDRLFTSYYLRSIAGTTGTIIAGGLIVKSLQSGPTQDYSNLYSLLIGSSSLYYSIRNLNNHLNHENTHYLNRRNNYIGFFGLACSLYGLYYFTHNLNESLNKNVP